MVKRCPLVLIEWEDSRQPASGWAHLSSIDEPSVVRCVSVGWLIHNGSRVKMLAPNLGDLDDEDNVQASGIIRIPARSVIKLTALEEPELTASSCPDLSSRLGPRRKRQATASP
mgnify:CR=1 FL=1